ncbi:MAG: RHS repeat protein [Candidatus Omnitrophica bacterium]|nr:RHS repeat protein [Candidatus Omnitrophota bacterium]
MRSHRTGSAFFVFLFFLASAVHAQTATSRIVVSPQYLVLYAVQGATTSQSQTFTISNGGTGTLHFNLSNATSWLSINTSSGSVTNNKATITATVNPSGLTSSSSPYIVDITISNTDIPQDTKKVRIRLSILASDAYVHSYQYDSKGNVVRRITPNGDIIEYAYDALGHMLHIYYPNSQEVDYIYGAVGNRISMTDWHGITTYGYDQLNRLRGVIYPNINPILYDYDKSGKLTAITYPDQSKVTYTYDTDGRLTNVGYTAGTVTYTYSNTSNNLTQKTLPNGAYTTYSYDLAKRITDTINKQSNGSLISSYHYAYDANSNITQEIETTPTATTIKNYIYDKLNRLTNVNYSDGTYETYTYDSMGNRLTMTTQTGTTTYEYDSDNRLIRAGSTYYFYDKNGNTIKKVSPLKTETYQYDYNNMLTQYSDGTNTVTYQYDGDRNRIAKVVNGTITNYINDINRPVVQVLMETNANLVMTKRYVYGNELISQEAF